MYSQIDGCNNLHLFIRSFLIVFILVIDFWEREENKRERKEHQFALPPSHALIG